jgi:probable phosphoglycerate mutase
MDSEASNQAATDISDCCMDAAAMQVPDRAFFFLRHGETDYNREGRFQGRIDVALNNVGVAQAETVVDTLRGQKISTIVSSPARRVLQTVRPLMQANAIPLQIDNDLMEFFVGGFEGRRIDSVRQIHGLHRGESWLSILPDDADCWREFVPRVCSTVRRWTERHSDKPILVASHGLVFRALSEALIGKPLSTRNAEPQYFRPAGDRWVVSAVQTID